MTRVAVFPGQGAQAVGMGRTFHDMIPQARRIFAEVDDALGEPLSTIVFEGPSEALTATANAQPALMAVSMAAVRAVEERAGGSFSALFDVTAGHSLGEYSALAAAGAISVPDAARLLRLRGRAMQEAVPAGEGAMAAILGASVELVEALASEVSRPGEPCEVANENADDQIVISGAKAAVERAVSLAPQRGAKRAVLLQVSAPFHCSLMAPAAGALETALERIELRRPQPRLIPNVTAQPTDTPDEVRHLLSRQVTARVRWRETMTRLRELDATLVVEFGSGRVLTSLAKRALPGVQVLSVQSVDDVDVAVAALCA